MKPERPGLFFGYKIDTLPCSNLHQQLQRGLAIEFTDEIDSVAQKSRSAIPMLQFILFIAGIFKDRIKKRDYLFVIVIFEACKSGNAQLKDRRAQVRSDQVYCRLLAG